MRKKSESIEEEETDRLLKAGQTAFREIVEDARFAGPNGKLPEYIKNHIHYVEEEFQRLFGLLEKSEKRENYAAIRDRIEELEKHRFYVAPLHDLVIEADGCLEDLSAWGIPEESLKLFSNKVARLKQNDMGDTPEKRSLMMQMDEDYEFWDGYVDWAVKMTTTMRAVSFALIVLGLFFSLFFLAKGSSIEGFIAAGVAGASLSVLFKIPQITQYKKMLALYTIFFSRVAAGIVASVIGMALLSTRLINLTFDFGSQARTITDILCAPSAQGCPLLGRIFLTGLGIVFGFSERILSSFENIIVGKLKASGKDAGESVDKQSASRS